MHCVVLTIVLGLGYRASSPSRAGHVTVAHSMTNPIDGNWYENECVSTGCMSFDINM